MTILLISSANAIIVENPLPTITTTFNEPVVITSVNADLKDSASNSIYIELLNITNNNKTFKYRPIEYLDEGNYYFTIQAEDIYGNQGDLKTEEFTLTIPPLSLSLYNPFFTITPNNPFDISIESTLPADCKYSVVPKDYEDMNSELTTSNNFIHILQSYNLNQISHIYFACFSDYQNETAYNDFEFDLDEDNPIIQTISADNVAEYPIESELYVKTDKETICAYSKNSTEFEQMDLFESTDPENQESYTLTHLQLLGQNDLEDFSTNTFYVVCKSLSTRTSQSKKIDIEVSSQSQAIVLINSPRNDEYYLAGSTNFSLTTNKIAKCHFSENQTQITGSGGTFGTFTKDHNAILQLSEGTYKYYFQCLVNTPEGLLDPISTEFSLDATSPYIIYVDDSNNIPGLGNLSEVTYKDNELFVEIKAVDNESGIEGYNYSIWKDNTALPESDLAILNWTFEETGKTIFSILTGDLDLKDTAKYYFKVKAKNKAGIWSPEKTSNGITIRLDLGSLGACYNNIKDNTETDVDCGGLCTKCADTKSCQINNDCKNNFCNPSTKKCEASSTCNNNILDSGESDIDCGGSCESCFAGYSCTQNSDCQGNFCDPNTRLCISTDTCSNNQKDSGESDIDCGINCPPCEDTKSCLSDFDCSSGYCDNEGICKGQSSCGNNEWNLGEQCDGQDSTQLQISCQDFTFAEGTLSCQSSCLIDTSQCQDLEEVGTICGDGIINSGEQCDGTALPNLHCFDFGDYESGTLSCDQCILSMESCTTELNPLQDTDNDGMPDKYELTHFNCRTCADPYEDTDNDGLENKDESLLCSRKGTDPKKEDTDNDGHSDLKEKDKGTNPCDPSEYPSSSLVLILIIIFVILVLLGGTIYYLYTKKSIIITKQPPFIKVDEKVKTFNDLVNGPPKPKQEPRHEDYQSNSQAQLNNQKFQQQSKQSADKRNQQIKLQKQQVQKERENRISKRKLARKNRRRDLFSTLTSSSNAKPTSGKQSSNKRPQIKLPKLKPLKLVGKKKVPKQSKPKPQQSQIQQKPKIETPKQKSSQKKNKSQQKQDTKQNKSNKPNTQEKPIINQQPPKPQTKQHPETETLNQPTNNKLEINLEQTKLDKMPKSKSHKKLFED